MGETSKSSVPQGPATAPKSTVGAEPHATDAPPPTHGGGHGHLEWPIHFGFLEKLKQRNVGRVAILYVIAAYVFLETFEVFFHLLDLPAWVGRGLVATVVLGFPIALIFAWLYEITPEGLKLAVDVPEERSIRKLTGRRLDRAIIAVLSVALVYFVVDKFWIRKHSAGSLAIASIAVLPLANESGDASQQYFSDGISEDLITALAQFPKLKVIGRSSAFQFRDSKEDSRSIGAKLGVAHLLEGSVRHSGDVVRVSAELIDTADGSTQWSERYDRPYQDLFALQDEITRAVAGALQARLLPGDHAAAQSDRPPSGSLEAYNAWLQGNFHHLRLSEAGFRKAIEYYTQATQIDARYARAWSSLATDSVNLGDFLQGAAAQEAYAKAREAADRALTLAPDSAAAHRARGALLLTTADFDWRGADAELRRAMELAPNDGPTKAEFGLLLLMLGQPAQSIELIRQALATDPLRPDFYFELTAGLFALNRLDEAERAVRRGLELQPEAPGYYLMLALIAIQRGDAQAALAAAQQVPTGPLQDLALATARQIGTDRGAADAALRMLIEKYANAYPAGIADSYALRNDATSAFEWLDRAWSSRDSEITTLLSDPFILRYKNDPRFAAFCRKVGLPVPGEFR